MKPDHQADLLITCLHAEEDEIGGGAGQTPLQVGLASYLFCFCVVVVQRLHCVLKQSPFNLVTSSRVGKTRVKQVGDKHLDRTHRSSTVQVDVMPLYDVTGSVTGWVAIISLLH